MVIIALLRSGGSADAGSLDEYFDERREISWGYGLRGWFSTAEATWKISFPYTTTVPNPGIPAGTPGKGESELNFKGLQGPIAIATAGGRLSSLLSFDVFYGSGAVPEGQGTDSDRFAPASGGSLEFSRSQNETSGRTRLWGINIRLNDNPFAYPRKSSSWGMVVGLLHYEDHLAMQNGVQTVSVPFDGNTFPPPGPFPSTMILDSTYDFSWHAARVAVTHQARMTVRLSYTGMLSVYPYVDYRGEGYWNIRAGYAPTDFRMQSPNFIHQASHGYGFDAMLGINYDFSEMFALSAGYWYLRLEAGDGTDTVYYASGATGISRLDEVCITRQGAYAELRFRY